MSSPGYNRAEGNILNRCKVAREVGEQWQLLNTKNYLYTS